MAHLCSRFLVCTFFTVIIAAEDNIATYCDTNRTISITYNDGTPVNARFMQANGNGRNCTFNFEISDGLNPNNYYAWIWLEASEDFYYNTLFIDIDCHDTGNHIRCTGSNCFGISPQRNPWAHVAQCTHFSVIIFAYWEYSSTGYLDTLVTALKRCDCGKEQQLWEATETVHTLYTGRTLQGYQYTVSDENCDCTYSMQSQGALYIFFNEIDVDVLRTTGRRVTAKVYDSEGTSDNDLLMEASANSSTSHGTAMHRSTQGSTATIAVQFDKLNFGEGFVDWTSVVGGAKFTVQAVTTRPRGSFDCRCFSDQTAYGTLALGQSQMISSNNYDDDNYTPCYGLSTCTMTIATYDGLVLRYEWQSNTETLLRSGALVKTSSWDNYANAHPDLTCGQGHARCSENENKEPYSYAANITLDFSTTRYSFPPQVPARWRLKLTATKPPSCNNTFELRTPTSVSVPQYETITCYYTVQVADQSPLYNYPQVSTNAASQCEFSLHKTATIYDGSNVNVNRLAVWNSDDSCNDVVVTATGSTLLVVYERNKARLSTGDDNTEFRFLYTPGGHDDYTWAYAVFIPLGIFITITIVLIIIYFCVVKPRRKGINTVYAAEQGVYMTPASRQNYAQRAPYQTPHHYEHQSRVYSSNSPYRFPGDPL